MTPLEIVDYKGKWAPGYTIQVDVDSERWGKTFCSQNIEKHTWSFRKHTMPDDSHTFYFEDQNVADQFLTAYNKHNPSFHSVGEVVFTDDELKEKIAALEQTIVDMTDLIATHKANGKLETAEACEKIRKVYKNDLHYVQTLRN